MPASKLIKGRNATIAVTANAEVLFVPAGEVYGWTARFTEAIERATEAEAPVNKRPRWGHYGKPLKSTFSSDISKPRAGRHSGLRIYAAVGSSAGHAKYVDQGTGVFNGGSPWKAKVLPPYAQGSPSLYEHTWHPQGSGRASHTVMIKGQPGQHFFDKGLRRGFQQMRVPSFELPGVDPRMGDILRTWPRELENFSGNTPANGAFVASLLEWRSWRDEAFNAGRVLGRDPASTAEAQRRRGRSAASIQRRADKKAATRVRRAEESKHRSQKRRDRIKAEKPKGQMTRAKDMQRVKMLATKRFGASNIVSIEWDGAKGWEVVVQTLDGTRVIFKTFHIKAKSI